MLEGKSSPIIPSAHARALPLLSPSGTPAQNAHTPYSPECATYSRVAGVPTRRSRRLRRSRRAAEAKRKGGVQRIRTRPDTPVAHMFSRLVRFRAVARNFKENSLENFSQSKTKKNKKFFFLFVQAHVARVRQAAGSRRGAPPRRAESDAVTPAGRYPEVPSCPVPASRALAVSWPAMALVWP